MSIKKLEALTMYDIGMSKTSIRKKINVKVERLNKWLNEDTSSIKDRALRMYFMNIPLEVISTKLYISDIELDNWIKVAHKKMEIPDKYSKAKIHTIPGGYSKWIDKIFINYETAEKIRLLKKIKIKVSEIAHCS